MKLPKAVRERFRAYGREGGRTRATRMSPEARTAVARKAALRRWTRARFGSPRFESLGLPGGRLIDAGLVDLVRGRETVASLVVSLAAPRLSREGVPLPPGVFTNADHRLYRLLERENPDLAHARYLAYLREAQSFADACSIARRPGDVHA
jgi:hypothetical protein